MKDTKVFNKLTKRLRRWCGRFLFVRFLLHIRQESRTISSQSYYYITVITTGPVVSTVETAWSLKRSLVNKALFTKLPDEGPLLETSKILNSYFSGRSKPNLLRRYLRSLYLHWQLLFMIGA